MSGLQGQQDRANITTQGLQDRLTQREQIRSDERKIGLQGNQDRANITHKVHKIYARLELKGE